jgi:hypothetical protein
MIFQAMEGLQCSQPAGQAAWSSQTPGYIEPPRASAEILGHVGAARQCRLTFDLFAQDTADGLYESPSKQELRSLSTAGRERLSYPGTVRLTSSDGVPCRPTSADNGHVKSLAWVGCPPGDTSG